jgi:hypothetical protein
MPTSLEDEGDEQNPLELNMNETRFVSFGIPTDKFVELTMKLQSVNVWKTKFFLEVVNGVLDDDPTIYEFINRRVKKIKKSLLNNLEKDKQKEQKQKDLFGLDPDDIEDIYSVLEREVEP